MSKQLLTILLALIVTSPVVAQEASSTEGLEVQTVVLQLLDEAEVAAQESGVVIEMNVREGDTVKKGQLLVRIDDRVARLAERTALVELKAAKEAAANDVDLRSAIQSYELAKAELKRSIDSIARFPKSVSQSQIDVERLHVEKARLEQEQAQHETIMAEFQVKLNEQAVAAARVELALRKVTAPFAGTVVETSSRVGEWVDSGAAAVRIISVQRLKAEGFVTASPSDLPKQGDSVHLKTSDDDQSHSHRGKVIFISPEMDPITGQVRIWAEIDNSQLHLRPGQRARMWVSATETSE